MRIRWRSCWLSIVASLVAARVQALPVFPDARGFGTDTPAGRGGIVYRVTTLDDRGPGSLRSGIEDLTGARTIIFDVAGVIRLQSDLVVRPGHGFLTVAGQTAPFPGITLADGGLAIRGHDVLVQHIAIRPGDRLRPVDNRDCIKIEAGPDESVHHVVIDHVSASWAVDETVSTWSDSGSVRDVTFSNCLFYEPIINGGHSKGSHPYGALGGRNTANLTLVGNILAFCWGRNPLIRDRTGGAQIVNNLIYRPGIWSNGVIYLGDLELPPHAVTVAGNVILRHPVPFDLEMTDEKGERTRRSFAASDYRNTGIYVHKVVAPDAGLFLSDNRFFDPRDDTMYPRDGDAWSSEIFRDTPDQPVTRLPADPYANSGGTRWGPMPASEVENRLLAHAGKMPLMRDPLDTALIEKITARTGSYLEDLAPSGGDPWASVDLPHQRRLALPADPSGDADGDGYTNLEEWLHGLASGVEVGGQRWSATELAREDFSEENWGERWVVEGHARTKVSDGRLSIATLSQAGLEPATTLWWRKPLPENLLIELMAGADLPAEENAANLNVILHAREKDGSAYRAGRSGVYSEYHAIPNYILTLTGGFQEGWARVRRNPGFSLLGENRNTRSEPGRSCHIRIAVTEGRIRYWLDGALIHDVTDSTPLHGGHFAFRTWRSRVWLSELRIFELKRVAEVQGGRVR